jgi:hypothetical protein
MGKKKSREGQTSNGERRNVGAWSIKAVRNSVGDLTAINNKIKAWKKGKRVTITIANPITSETNKPFVKRDAKDVWGKYNPYIMKTQ